MTPPRRRVLFRVASGPRRGFGHVVRALRLGAALDADVWVSPRGPRPALAPARHVRYAADAVGVLDGIRPDLLVIDTPILRDGLCWLRAARARRVAVASIHDCGIAPLASDLAIDGSLAATAPIPGARRTLLGARYIVIDNGVRRSYPRRAAGQTVVIALGGGPRVTLAGAIASRLRQAAPGVRIRVAGGLAGAGRVTRRQGIEWLGPQQGLARILAAADLAVVAGGLTLYEAAAIGTPAVAVPIVRSQRPAVEAFARARAVSAPPPEAGAAAIADAAADLLSSPGLAARMAKRARRLVDGRGTARVAAALERLVEEAS